MRILPARSGEYETHLVGIAADTGDTFDGEIEGPHGEPGLFQERHDEAAQTAVDV